jgi:hypothetical protein
VPVKRESDGRIKNKSANAKNGSTPIHAKGKPAKRGIKSPDVFDGAIAVEAILERPVRSMT